MEISVDTAANWTTAFDSRLLLGWGIHGPGLVQPNGLPLSRAVLRAAGARRENHTTSMAVNGTAPAAVAELAKRLVR